MFSIFNDPQAWQAITLTLKLASVSTLALILLATPLAWWLAQRPTWPRQACSTLLTLPLVLPPSVMGFYLLLAMGPQGWLGECTQFMGLGLLSFTFNGLVLGSVVYSLPFALQPLQAAFEGLDPRALEMAYTLKANPIDAFFHVTLPSIQPALLTATVLSFAHTVGEFGIVLMIGGNIPNQTQMISTLIYNDVEAMQYPQAHALSFFMVCFSFLVILMLKRFGHLKSLLAP